jgi:filamentous hemagglutinin family protein
MTLPRLGRINALKTGKLPRKHTRSGRLVHCPVAAVLGMILASDVALAAPGSTELPTGGTVVGGSATIASSGARLDINQTSGRAAIDWNTFNIGSDAHVHFQQPAGGVALNRVLASDASQIYGRLTSTGQVFLLNPQGIYFAPGAQVDVGGLVASTLNLSNANFMAGNYAFQGGSSNAIINQGNITAASGGTLALIAAKITNDGTLSAPGGNVLLGAGSKVTLDMGGPVKLQIENSALETLIANGGAIRAEGGTIWLTSQAAATLASSVINNTGLIEAQALTTGAKGEIILFAHDGHMQVGGTIAAPGGFVETSGKIFAVTPGASIQAGHWLIDPVNITIDTTLASTLVSALGSGDVTVTTAGSNTPDTSAAESGTEGNINVNSDVIWATAHTLTLSADNNIAVNADITASNGSAGVIFLYGQGTTNGGSSAYSVATGKAVTADSIQWRKGSDPAGLRYAIVNGNVFLGNGFIELGLNKTLGGKFGTTTKPSLFFGRQGGEVGIGMTGDADGFGTGTDLRIDYFLPGNPEERFTAGFEISGTPTSDFNFATAGNSAVYEILPLGSDNILTAKVTVTLSSNLKVVQLFKLGSADKYFSNQVTLENVGASALDNARFIRSFDPDNTRDMGGISQTTQKIEQTIAAGDSANVVSAISAAGDAYATAAGGNQSKIIYFSTTAGTSVGFGSEFFPSNTYAGMVTKAASQVKGNTITADQGMGMLFNAGTLAVGASKTFTYLTSLDNRDLSTILSELEVASPAATPAATTDNTPRDTAIKIAQGQPVEVSTSGTTTQPVFGMPTGLSYVAVDSTTTTGTADGSQTTGTSDGKDLPTDAGDTRTPAGFMRVFVVAGGVNLPDQARDLSGLNPGGKNDQDKASGGTAQ